MFSLMMTEKSVILFYILCALGIVVAITLIAFGLPIFGRYQKRAEANNEVFVNEITIRQQEQLIKVEKQKAQIRIEEAKGLSESQKIIDKSLTTNYLQYMAIKAQEKMAGSPNHTQVYIPSGTNGIPLVKTIE